MQFRKFIACLMALAIFQSGTCFAAGILRDDEIERSLRSMSAPIFKQAGIPPRAVTFILVDDNQLNAFVASGQNIFINTGLILATDNIEELLGVIAHETGHIASGHLVRFSEESSGLSVKTVLSSLLGIAIAMGTGNADAGVAVTRLGSDIALKDTLKHTRTQEGSADQSGIRFLQGAGLPVSGLLSFMKKLEKQELLPASQQSEYLQTHPLTEDRILAMQYAVDNSKAVAVPLGWEDAHARMKAKTLGYLSPDEQLSIKGDDFATRYGHAVAYSRKGDFDKALPLIDKLLASEPKNPFLYELKAQALYDRGEIEGAIKAYKSAIEILPDSALIRLGYGYALLAANSDKSTHEKEAIANLNQALKYDRQISEPYHLLAMAYGRQGDEGMASLSSAEEALMTNNREFARISAMRAQSKLQKGTPGYQRADDILNSLPDEKEKNDGKKR